MKKNLIIVLLTIIALATSCKDAIICTDCDKGKDSTRIDTSKVSTHRIMDKVWYLDSLYTDTIQTFQAFKYDKSGKFYEYSRNSRSTNLLDISYDSTNGDVFQENKDKNLKYKVFELTATSLVLMKSSNNGITFTKLGKYRTVDEPRSDSRIQLYLTGLLKNPNKIKLDGNTRIYLMFTMRKGNSTEYIYNYIEGKVKADSIYEFFLNEDLPFETYKESAYGGKIAYGEIILTTAQFPAKTKLGWEATDSKTYRGGVSPFYNNQLMNMINTGIVWKSGKFSNGSEFKWEDAHPDGFSVALYEGDNNYFEPSLANKKMFLPLAWMIAVRRTTSHYLTGHNNLLVTTNIKDISYPVGWYY